MLPITLPRNQGAVTLPVLLISPPVVKLPLAIMLVTVLPPSVPTFSNDTTLALPYAEVGLTFTPPPEYSVVKLFDDTFAIFFYLI
jgi:hypothetical protein